MTVDMIATGTDIEPVEFVMFMRAVKSRNFFEQMKDRALDNLLQAVAQGNVEPEVLGSVAARLARLDRDLTEPDKQRIVEASGGASLKDLARGIVDALNPDVGDVIAAQAAIQASARPSPDPPCATC